MDLREEDIAAIKQVYAEEIGGDPGELEYFSFKEDNQTYYVCRRGENDEYYFAEIEKDVAEAFFSEPSEENKAGVVSALKDFKKM